MVTAYFTSSQPYTPQVCRPLLSTRNLGIRFHTKYSLGVHSGSSQGRAKADCAGKEIQPESTSFPGLFPSREGKSPGNEVEPEYQAFRGGRGGGGRRGDRPDTKVNKKRTKKE